MRGSEPRPQRGNPAGTRLGCKWEHGEPRTTPAHRPAPPNCRAGRAGLQCHQPGSRQSLPSTARVLPRNVGGLAEQSLGKKPFPHTHEGRRAPARGESCLPLHSGSTAVPRGPSATADAGRTGGALAPPKCRLQVPAGVTTRRARPRAPCEGAGLDPGWPPVPPRAGGRQWEELVRGR